MAVKKPRTISEQLRAAIDAAGESRYAISKATGINQSILSRFVRGETKLDGDNIDKVATYLGLQLVAVKQQRKGR